MKKTSKPPLLGRLSFALGGLAALILVGSLLWAGFTAPLNSRMPVPSPDARYFAYFNHHDSGGESRAPALDLVIANPHGELAARMPTLPGRIAWSNANHLVVFDQAGSQATIIANADVRFVPLAQLRLRPHANPQWASDGNKLACIRQLDTAAELVVYDVQQPQVFPVTMPEGFRLHDPRLIAWSPGSEMLYFVDQQDKLAVIYQIGVRSGALRELVRGRPAAEGRLPQLSPDGTRIYWGEPENAVFDLETGSRIWTLPPRARPLWWPWSRDSSEFYFALQEDEGSVYSHNFFSSADQRVISGVRHNGFFDLDGASYFYREPVGGGEGQKETAAGSLRASPAWREAGRTVSPQTLGGVELWPWERTIDGFILARRDAATHVQYGLFDPETRRLDTLTFPTEREDFVRQVRSYRLVIATVVLFTLLAAIVYIKRSDAKSGRAFPILLLLAMTLVCGSVMGSSFSLTGHTIPYRITLEEIGNQGWGVSSALPQLFFRQAQVLMTWIWALLPLAILNFALSFPDRAHFLRARGTVRSMLLGVATLPILVTGLARFIPGITPAMTHYVAVVAVVGAAFVWALSLGVGYQHPTGKPARQSVVWFIAALCLLGGAYLVHKVLPYGLEALLREPEGESLKVVHLSFFILAAWVAPAGMAYAVAARKPLSLGRFISKVFRQGLMGIPALAAFTIAWAVTGLVVSGSLWAFSPLAIVLAVLVAVLSVLPFRGRLRVAIDRRFDRARYESRQRLANLARSLPHVVDRETLARQLEEAIMKSMQARWCLLFVEDRATRKLQFQRARTAPSAEISRMTFALDEPLCRYLKSTRLVFEPQLESTGAETEEVMASAGERLGKLQAEIVLGLCGAELHGLVILGPKTTPDSYDSEDLVSLRLVAREATAALENISLFEMAAHDREVRKELEMAADIQAKLLPTHVPKLTAGQIAGCCYPARSIAGDYYDFMQLPERKVGLIMCDVSGKGMPAALKAASLEKALASGIPATLHLGQLVQNLNRDLNATAGPGDVATLFIGIFDDANRRLEYVNAGHPPPLLLTSEGSRFLESTGLPLGLFADISHEPRSIVLPPGAMLLIYSDGAVDARDPSGDSFGKERLGGALYRDLESDAEQALSRVVAEIREFEGDTILEDDQAFILLKIHQE